jgi:hypothetical protein
VYDKPMRGTLQLFAALSVLTLPGCGGSSSTSGPQTFNQIDRTGRPGVNTLFATVSGNEHALNDANCVCSDDAILGPEIQAFMTTAAGRSHVTANAASTLLAPNALEADLSSSAATAGFLGVETSGKIGTNFGGRALTDDAMVTLLGIAFGSSLSAWGLAPDDGKETPGLTDDHVAQTGRHFSNTFPYLGPPN